MPRAFNVKDKERKPFFCVDLAAVPFAILEKGCKIERNRIKQSNVLIQFKMSEEDKRGTLSTDRG